MLQMIAICVFKAASDYFGLFCVSDSGMGFRSKKKKKKGLVLIEKLLLLLLLFVVRIVARDFVQPAAIPVLLHPIV